MLRKQNKIMKIIKKIKKMTLTTTIKIKTEKFRVTNLLNLTTLKKAIKINFRRCSKINKMKEKMKIEIVIKTSHRQNLTIVFVIHVTNRIILLLISCVRIMRKRKSNTISIKISRRKKKKSDACRWNIENRLETKQISCFDNYDINQNVCYVNR